MRKLTLRRCWPSCEALGAPRDPAPVAAEIKAEREPVDASGCRS